MLTSLPCKAEATADNYHDALIILCGREASLRATEAANASALVGQEEETIEKWKVDYDAPMPKAGDKNIVNRFEFNSEGFGEQALQILC